MAFSSTYMSHFRLQSGKQSQQTKLIQNYFQCGVFKDQTRCSLIFTLSLEGVNYQPSSCLPFCLVWQSRLYSLGTAVQQHFITHKQNMYSCVTWSSKFPHDAMVPRSFVALIGYDCNKMKPQIQCYFWCSFPLHKPLSILTFLPYLFIQHSHFHL